MNRRPPTASQGKLLAAIKAKPGITKPELAIMFDTVEPNITRLLNKLHVARLAHSKTLKAGPHERRGWYSGVPETRRRVSSVFELGSATPT